MLPVNRSRSLLLASVALGALALGLPAVLPNLAHAQAISDNDALNEEILLQADELIHDREQGTVLARGAVELVQGARILRASEIFYNQKTGDVRARGNVSILQETGDVMFAEEVQLDDRLQNGFIEKIRLILSDNSRMAAHRARRIDGRITKLSKVVYSPCEPCKEKPDRELIWQLKAERVVHDEQSKSIEYEHARLEVFGIPVAYTPYFSHPDPSVKRKSGFLTPEYGSSGDLGLNLKTPYYHAFNDQQDMTITPFITESDGAVGSIEYRQLFEDGNLLFDGSLAYTETQGSNDRGLRGHIDAEATFDINRLWRWGADIEHASDDTYLRKFNFNGASILESKAFVEGFDDQDFVQIRMAGWQGLLAEDDPGQIPFLWPQAIAETWSDYDSFGGRYRLAGHFLNLTRDEGSDNVRLIGEAEYELPFQTSWGDQIEFSVGSQIRTYFVDTNNLAQDDGAKDGLHGSVWPWMEVTWTRPYVSPAGTATQYFEPIVQLHASPYGSTGGAPNNDSTSPTIDQSNLFETNRFAGFDRLSGGPRVTWGGKYYLVGQSGGYSGFFLGQSYRFSEDATYEKDSGFDKKLSDIIAAIEIEPGSFLSLNSGLALDGTDFGVRRAETAMTFGPSFFRTSLSHALVRAAAGQNEFDDAEQFSANTRIKWTDTYFSKGNFSYDLEDSRPVQWAWSIGYEDECLLFEINARETYPEDQNVGSDVSIGFGIQLKNLG